MPTEKEQAGTRAAPQAKAGAGALTDEVLEAFSEDSPYLNLTDAPVTDRGMAILKKRGGALKTLHVRGCVRITVTGFKHIAALPRLEVLYVDGTQLTDEVAEVLATCPKLTRLEIRGNARASGRTMTPLRDALRRNNK